MGLWGDFQGLTEATRGGRGVKKFENWGDVVYGWSSGALVLPTARLQLIVSTTALFSCHIRFRPLHTLFATG